MKRCPKCTRVLAVVDNFYRYGDGRPHGWCKECNKGQVLERQRLFKQQCVDYKGGCCELCGYARYVGALQFHHCDAQQKDFQIAAYRQQGFTAKVRAELDKCKLLCANCHAETHAAVERVLPVEIESTPRG